MPETKGKSAFDQLVLPNDERNKRTILSLVGQHFRGKNKSHRESTAHKEQVDLVRGKGSTGLRIFHSCFGRSNNLLQERD